MRLKGFTLSEVLLVLAIIGVIAALSIPTLIQKASNIQSIAKLKKEYSTLSQAYTMLMNENGGSIVPIYTNDNINGGANVVNAFASKLNIIKNCGTGMGCWYNSPRYNLNGSQYASELDNSWNNKYGKSILADGTMFLVTVDSTNCTANFGSGPLSNSCGIINVDVNGANGPNTSGRDFFQFSVTQTGIYPKGLFNDGTACDPVIGDSPNSIGCTAKILTEGEMNY